MPPFCCQQERSPAILYSESTTQCSFLLSLLIPTPFSIPISTPLHTPFQTPTFLQIQPPPHPLALSSHSPLSYQFPSLVIHCCYICSFHPTLLSTLTNCFTKSCTTDRLPFAAASRIAIVTGCEVSKLCCRQGHAKVWEREKLEWTNNTHNRKGRDRKEGGREEWKEGRWKKVIRDEWGRGRV